MKPPHIAHNASTVTTHLASHPPGMRKPTSIPLLHLLLTSDHPTRLLTRALASPGLMRHLTLVLLLFALSVVIHAACHRLRTTLGDLDKRRQHLAWLARLLYTHATLALLVYAYVQPGWLGVSLLLRAFLMCLQVVLKTVVDVVSGEVDERVLREVAQGTRALGDSRRPPATVRGGRRVLRVSPSIVLLVREHEAEAVILRFRRSLSSGSVLMNEPPAQILLVQRTARIASMDDLLLNGRSSHASSLPTSRTTSQASLLE